MRFLRNSRTSRSSSWPSLFVSVQFCKICYSCYFCHICYSVLTLFTQQEKVLLLLRFLEICGLVEVLLDLYCKCRILLNLLFLLFLPYLSLNLFTKQKKCCYFCDFCGLHEAIVDLFSFNCGIL